MKIAKQGPDLRYLRWAIWKGGHFFARAHFVELNISKCFIANQNSLAEDEETIQIFQANFFEAIVASKWPPRPNVTLLS